MHNTIKIIPLCLFVSAAISAMDRSAFNVQGQYPELLEQFSAESQQKIIELVKTEPRLQERLGRYNLAREDDRYRMRGLAWECVLHPNDVRRMNAWILWGPGVAEGYVNFTQLKTAQEKATCYKIHLMPKPEDLESVVLTLQKNIHERSDLRAAIGDLKFLAFPEKYDTYGRTTVPIVVIYPHLGKKNAQKVLDILCDIFKDHEGLGVAPSFNRRITSLIFYAQGDRTEKQKCIDARYVKEYEEDMVHYAEDYTPSGANQGYYLQNPAEAN